MKYQYCYRTTAWEFWQLSMYYTYGSIIGVCNIIFTVALFALTITMWSSASDIFRLFMLIGCSLFTIMQPLLVYQKAKAQAAGILEDTNLGFADDGIHVTVGTQSSKIKWNKIKRISKKPTMMIIFSDTTHGFVLTNRTLGTEKEEFFTYVNSKITKH